MKDIGYRNAVAVSALPTASIALAGVTVRLTSDNKPYWCDGATWTDLSVGRAITVSGTAPVSPSLNDLWLEI